jgi:hypothetical protein
LFRECDCYPIGALSEGIKFFFAETEPATFFRNNFIFISLRVMQDAQFQVFSKIRFHNFIIMFPLFPAYSHIRLGIPGNSVEKAVIRIVNEKHV